MKDETTKWPSVSGRSKVAVGTGSEQRVLRISAKGHVTTNHCSDILKKLVHLKNFMFHFLNSLHNAAKFTRKPRCFGVRFSPRYLFITDAINIVLENN